MSAISPGRIRAERPCSAGSGLAALACLALALSLAACTTTAGPHTAGTLSGKLTLRTAGEDRLVYEPDKHDPLTFVTTDGQRIRPQRIYTDGGTIPPAFWVVPGLFPWEYAPAYVVHDWLFRQHHCRYAGHSDVSFEDSARILDEVMDTLERRGLVSRNPRGRALIDHGARSGIARVVWKHGLCTRQEFGTAGQSSSGMRILKLDFSRRRTE